MTKISENPQSVCRLCLELLENEAEGKSVKGDLEMKINEIFPSNVSKLKQNPNFFKLNFYLQGSSITNKFIEFSLQFLLHPS